jgi:hypothetical protein
MKLQEIAIGIISAILGLATYFLWFSTIGRIFLP